MEVATTITLNNEMDLILAHKRSMRVAELAGFSLAVQTTFATAVSEVARKAIEEGTNARLQLGVKGMQTGALVLSAVIFDENKNTRHAEGISHAKKLIDDVQIVKTDENVQVGLYLKITNKRITTAQVREWKEFFLREPVLSAYDEIKRNNEQLYKLTDKLKASEQQYKTLTDTLPLLMFSLSNTGQLIYTNKGFAKFTGQTNYLLNETKWSGLIHSADFNAFWEAWNGRLKAGDNEIKGEYRLKDFISGEYLWQLVSFTPVKDEQGIPHYYIGYMVDINSQKLVEETLKANTELKEVKKQLEDNQHQLEDKIEQLSRSNYELSSFAYVASHDLQEPLRKIILFSDRVKNDYADKIDEAGKRMLEVSVQSAVRMQQLIYDLLALSELNPMQVSIDDIDLNVIAKEVLHNLDLLIKDKNANVIIYDLPVIKGNGSQIRQLFQNLIANAVKFAHPERKAEVKIYAEVTEQNVIVTVEDNGIGFDKIYEEKIFGLFQRLHARNEYSGNGIGLTISRKIMELHKGNISATGVLNEGAKFTVCFPV